MCSVRHSPMPCAPSRRARAASSAVSALARTRSRRASSAWVEQPVHRLRPAHRSRRRRRPAPRPARPPGRWPPARPPPGRRRGTPRRSTPSMAITSPSFTMMSPTCMRARPGVDVQRLGPAHAGAAHAAGHHRRVRGLAAAAGQHPGRGDHAFQVVRVGLPAHQHHLLPGRGPGDRGGRVEHRRPHRRAGRRRQPARPAASARRAWSNCGNISRASCSPVTRCIASSIVIRFSSTSWAAIRNAARGGALAHPGLQHPQLAALDGELDVAQVPVVRLQPAHHGVQLLRRARVPVGQVGQGQRVADPGDHVLALRVGQVVAVIALACRWPGRG